jgi:hypothetical protein
LLHFSNITGPPGAPAPGTQGRSPTAQQATAEKGAWNRLPVCVFSRTPDGFPLAEQHGRRSRRPGGFIGAAPAFRTDGSRNGEAAPMTLTPVIQKD